MRSDTVIIVIDGETSMTSWRANKRHKRLARTFSLSKERHGTLCALCDQQIFVSGIVRKPDVLYLISHCSNYLTIVGKNGLMSSVARENDTENLVFGRRYPISIEFMAIILATRLLRQKAHYYFWRYHSGENIPEIFRIVLALSSWQSRWPTNGNR